LLGLIYKFLIALDILYLIVSGLRQILLSRFGWCDWLDFCHCKFEL